MALPAVAYGIGALGSVAGSIWGGQEADPKDAGDLHLVNAGQQDLWNSMLKKIQSGSGDFGAGQGIKQGKSQLAQFMADRGINPGGGTGVAGMADMIGTASAGANQNRLGYAMNLLGTPLQTAQTSGSNWLPGSPSQGYDAAAQRDHFVPSQHSYYAQNGKPFGQFTDRNAHLQAAGGVGNMMGSGSDAMNVARRNWRG